MEKPYIYLSLLMIIVLIMVFVATAALQTKIAVYAIILFSFILSLFYIRDKSEKIEVISFWFALIMFIIVAALIFQTGGV